MTILTPTAERHAPSRPATVDADERLHSLDILRGLALAGMILVHFHQRVEAPSAGMEDLIGWGIYILLEQKAWGTFALLFGAGFAVLLRRLEARGTPIVPLYLRRLATLALIGAAVELLFGFHILFEYAGWGLVLLLVRRWPTRALLALAAIAACARPLAAEAGGLYASWAGTAQPTGFDRTLWTAAADAAQHGGHRALLAARWALFVGTLPHRWRDFLPNANLALFVLGLLAIRHRVIDEPLRHVRLIARWMTFGAVSWALAWTVLRHLPTTGIAAIDWPLEAGLGLVQDQWLALTYAGAVVLLLARRPRWADRLRPVGLAGRMALTNYVAQAAFFDVLGSRYGLGLHVRPFVEILAWPALFAIMVLWSRGWLARFRYGPLEWLWRCATYARWEPLRLAPGASATVAVSG